LVLSLPVANLYRGLDGMARGGKAIAERESVSSWLSHYLPLLIATYLLAAPHAAIAALNDRFAPLSLWLVRRGADVGRRGLGHLGADAACGQLELGRNAQARP
jgi:hypothetical protein